MPGTFRLALHGGRRLEISQILLEESNRSPERTHELSHRPEPHLRRLAIIVNSHDHSADVAFWHFSDLATCVRKVGQPYNHTHPDGNQTS
jgi:hypothetical protein